MRQVSYSFATITQTEICALSATTTASGSTLPINGGMAQLPPGASSTLPYVQLPGITRAIAIYSTGNISTSTFTFTGLDITGNALTTSIAGPTGTAVWTKTTTEFWQVQTASIGATAATSPFTIGFGASGSTNAVVVDNFANPANLTYILAAAAGTPGPVTFQHTYDPIQTSTAPAWQTVTFSSGVALASITVATGITVTDNPTAVRAVLLATALPTALIRVAIAQSGS